jgi:two-component system, OmpR family, osmolarity sensor histidine kinase EnvZ
MKLMPQSIVARLTWLVALVGGLSFLLHALLVTFLARPLFNDMTIAVAGQVRLVKALVEQASTPPSEQDIQAILPANMRIQSSTEGRDITNETPLPARGVASALQQSLPVGVVLRIQDEPDSASQKQFVFYFEHAGQPWRIRYAVLPPTSLLLGSVLGWLSLVALGVSVSMFFGIRMVTRPMSEIAKQIAAQGNGIAPLPLPKQASEEIRAIVHAFNQLVDEVKTADAKKMQMLAGLSHDLRTPLTRLRLRAETRFQETDTEAFEQDISAMQKMIDQFMAYVHGNARASLGRPYPVIEQIKQVIRGYPDHLCIAQFEIHNLGIELPDTAFQRLLTNLLDNAFAHGGAAVKVVLSERYENGHQHAVLTVYDSGLGMTAEQFKKALQPFVRLVEANGVGHSGLGLAIVAQIADQFGGKLCIVRRSDQTFGIEFSWPIQKT